MAPLGDNDTDRGRGPAISGTHGGVFVGGGGEGSFFIKGPHGLLFDQATSNIGGWSLISQITGLLPAPRGAPPLFL